MHIIRSLSAIREQTTAWRAEGKTIAFVPTMGALHAGHISLIRAARAQADYVIVSIFVNPTQFTPTEDYSAYPRNEETDCEICISENVDAVFIPEAADLFPSSYSTWVVEESVSSTLCGARRPGHFRGVCTVVLKLFMLCQPHYAYFGEKDAQQVRVIKRMVRDLHCDISIISCPTHREKDGLACSSRNVYLTPTQRTHACLIHEALGLIPTWRQSEITLKELRRKITDHIHSAPGVRVEYVEIVDDATLQPVTHPASGQKLCVAVAVFIGTTRLIDNTVIAW